MEFTFSLPGVQVEGVTAWDRVQIGGLDIQSRERLRLVIDTFGRNSARSQGLPASITDMFRLLTTNHKLYLATTQACGRLIVLGGIKTGLKKLFIRVETGAFQEIEPVCVLDFYVHEDYQRQGIGKRLFEHFLAAEGQTAASIGYDRPSHKFLHFIRKHYGLAQYIPQSNNFVVFSSYFHSASQDPAGSSWTSVSQRPLTAQKRLRGASASRRHSQQVSAEATPRRRAAAQPGIPMFRSTSGNKHSGVQPSAIDALLTGRLQHQQQQQQQSTADSMQTSRMQKPQKSQHESQQGPTQHCRDPNNTLGFWQQQDAAQHQRHRSADYVGFPQGAAAQHGIFQGSAPQQVAEEVSRPVEHARSQEAAAAQRGLSQGLYSQGANVGHSSAVQQTRLPQKALGMQSSLPAPVMYVKPPWAIDDPYQYSTASGTGNRAGAYGLSQYEAMPAGVFNTSQMLASSQRSGSEAKGCIKW